MKKIPIVSQKRLDEILQKTTAVFIKEKMSPFEVKIVLDVIYGNIEKLDDIYTKERLTRTLNAEQNISGVS